MNNEPPALKGRGPAVPQRRQNRFGRLRQSAVASVYFRHDYRLRTQDDAPASLTRCHLERSRGVRSCIS